MEILKDWLFCWLIPPITHFQHFEGMLTNYTLAWMTNDTKINVCKAVVLSTLLYGAELGVKYRHYLHLIERYHQFYLHTSLNIHSSNFVINIKIPEVAKVTSIEAMLIKNTASLARHDWSTWKTKGQKTRTLLKLPLKRPWRPTAVERFAYLGFQPSACLHQTRISSFIV